MLHKHETMHFILVLWLLALAADLEYKCVRNSEFHRVCESL